MKITNKAVAISILILVALQIYSINLIADLSRSLRNLQNVQRVELNNIQYEVNHLEDSIRNILKSESSLVQDASFEIEGLTTKTHEVIIDFQVQPKEVTDTMEVSLDFDGDILKLRQSGITFIGSRAFKINTEIKPKIIIKDNEISYVDSHEDLYVSGLKRKIFPELFASFNGKTKYRSETYSLDGYINFDYKPTKNENAFTDIEVFVKVDDQGIKRIPVALGDGYHTSIKLEEAFRLKKGELFSLNVVAIDDFGFVHESVIETYLAGSNAQREPYFEKIKIIAPNGDVVYDDSRK